MTAASGEARTYYPPPESEGGWRWLKGPEEVRSIGGMDPDRLQFACEWNALYSSSSEVVIIRHGYLVTEWYENHTLTPTRFDIWSCTKSFTGTAYGVLFEDSQLDKLSSDKRVDLDSFVYPLIPEGYPLSDPRKEQITFRHLLSMTSGIPGQRSGVYGLPTEIGVGPFEAALGCAPVKARRWPTERWASQLSAEPGTQWDYSDPAMAHLALAFYHVTGREISEFMQERVFDPIGIESLSWDMQGVGAEFIGPHTNAHTGIHICARELARFGYLMLRNGVWDGRQIVAPWWIEVATQTSQEFNPNYGYTWWVNTQGIQWPGVPRDAFAAMGHLCNRCYVIPSLDLVVVRIGSGPASWEEPVFIEKVVDAVIAD
ncbi:MAG: serine hydrolase domain-containing protein [Candidatus Bipolaricaulia bacterium]